LFDIIILNPFQKVNPPQCAKTPRRDPGRTTRKKPRKTTPKSSDKNADIFQGGGDGLEELRTVRRALGAPTLSGILRRGRLVWQLRPFELPAHSSQLTAPRPFPLLPSPPGDYIPPMLPLWGSLPPFVASGLPRAPSARRASRPSRCRGAVAAVAVAGLAAVPASAPGPAGAPVGPVRASLSPPEAGGRPRPPEGVEDRARGTRCRRMYQMLSQQRALVALLRGFPPRLPGFSRGRSGVFGRDPGGQSGGRGSGRGEVTWNLGPAPPGIKSIGQAGLIQGEGHLCTTRDAIPGRQTPRRGAERPRDDFRRVSLPRR